MMTENKPAPEQMRQVVGEAIIRHPLLRNAFVDTFPLISSQILGNFFFSSSVWVTSQLRLPSSPQDGTHESHLLAAVDKLSIKKIFKKYIY